MSLSVEALQGELSRSREHRLRCAWLYGGRVFAQLQSGDLVVRNAPVPLRLV